jgi:PadR family transcriptional regulator PadR
MSTQEQSDRLTLLQGTLDLLILRILLTGSQHGQGIARAIQESSGDALLVEHGALYPALQRLEAQDWIEAEWGVSDNNRKARFYTLTKMGWKQLVKEASRWRRQAAAIHQVLGPELA